jgi:transposase-like protein
MRRAPARVRIRSVLVERTSRGETFSDVARDYGVSREYVRQVAADVGATSPYGRDFWPRFWSRVPVAGPNDCWEWTGTRGFTGYGQLTHYTPQGTKTTPGAHRVALEYKLGRAVQGCALHRCDNPPCVNPAHLYEGTQEQNARDRDERCVSAKLGNRVPLATRASIRRGYLAGESICALAAKYGINWPTAARWAKAD